MSFWEENRKLCYGLLAAAVVLLVLWPSFGQGRPGIIRFCKPRYSKFEKKQEENAANIRKYYGRGSRLMSSVISDAEQFNDGLSDQYRELINNVIFIPAMPFKIGAWQPLPGLRVLEIQTEAHTMELLRYTSLRDVDIGDEFFGLNLGGVPPKKDRLPLLLRQLAMIDDLVRKATDCGVRRIDKVTPMGPMDTGPLNRPHFLAVYPVRMEIGAPVESVMKFVNSLDGYRGKVVLVRTAERTEGDRVVRETRVEIDVGRKHGLSPDQEVTFTIFDEVPDEEDGLRYKGRAYVKTVHDDRCVAIIPEDALPPFPEEERDKLEERKIINGDLATTNFYTLLDLTIEATQKKRRLTNDIEATVTVGAVGLLEKVKTPAGPRKVKAPVRTWIGGY